MAIVIDSSFIVSVFLENERNSKKAKEIFHDLLLKKDDIFVPTLLGPEVLGTIRRNTGDLRFCEIVEDKLNYWFDNMIHLKDLTRDSMNSAIETSIRLGLRGADAIFVSLAKDLNAEFLTFDEEVKKKIKDKVKLYS